MEFRGKRRAIFHRVTSAVVRAASTAAFRAKLWGKTLREINGVPLHKLTNEPLRREIHRQNAFAVAVYGRHLPNTEQKKLVDQIDRRTTIISNMPAHYFLQGIKLVGIGTLVYTSGGLLGAKAFIKPIGSGIAGAGIAFGARGLLAHFKSISAEHNNLFGRIKLSSKDIDSGSGVHEATHALQKSRKPHTLHAAFGNLANLEIMAETTRQLYLTLRTKNSSYASSPDILKHIEDPYIKGEMLGGILGGLILNPKTRSHGWTLLHRVNKGELTAEEAYKFAHRLTPVDQKEA